MPLNEIHNFYSCESKCETLSYTLVVLSNNFHFCMVGSLAFAPGVVLTDIINNTMKTLF